MNFVEKILYFLQGDMEVPTAFGWFHIMCLIIAFGMIFFLYKIKRQYSEKQLNVCRGIEVIGSARNTEIPSRIFTTSHLVSEARATDAIIVGGERIFCFQAIVITAVCDIRYARSFGDGVTEKVYLFIAKFHPDTSFQSSSERRSSSQVFATLASEPSSKGERMPARSRSSVKV